MRIVATYVGPVDAQFIRFSSERRNIIDIHVTSFNLAVTEWYTFEVGSRHALLPL